MSKDYKVESEFEHKGLKCVVVAQKAGHRCGYVGVPKGHSLYGKDAFSLYDWDKEEGVKIYVHGGVTFSDGGAETKYPIEAKDTWWFGFDTAHAGDKKDLNLIAELNPDMIGFYKEHFWSEFGDVRTLEYCKQECIELAEQLKEVTNED
jgi:hypothetical protein